MTYNSEFPAADGLHILGSAPSLLQAPVMGFDLCPSYLASLLPMDVCKGTLGFNAYVVARLVARTLLPKSRRRMLEVVVAKWQTAQEHPAFSPSPDCLNPARIAWISQAIDDGSLSEDMLDRCCACHAEAAPDAPSEPAESAEPNAPDRPDKNAEKPAEKPDAKPDKTDKPDVRLNEKPDAKSDKNAEKPDENVRLRDQCHTLQSECAELRARCQRLQNECAELRHSALGPDSHACCIYVSGDYISNQNIANQNNN